PPDLPLASPPACAGGRLRFRERSFKEEPDPPLTHGVGVEETRPGRAEAGRVRREEIRGGRRHAPVAVEDRRGRERRVGPEPINLLPAAPGHGTPDVRRSLDVREEELLDEELRK